MSLAGRVALVTGASRGLGQAIAERLHADGADLMLTARSATDLQAVGANLQTAGTSDARVLCEVMDVSQPRDVRRTVDQTVSAFARIDILVCNAGVYGPMGAITDVDWDEWATAIEINLYGTVLCVRAVLPTMRQQGYGKIITLSGGGATQPLPFISAYAAAKAAVVRFSETMAVELTGTGIDVNSVAPGALNTRLLDDVLKAGPDRVGADFYQRALRQKQEGGVPLSVGAELVSFLASSASDGITGRLLSGVWDDWRGLPARRDQLRGSDVFTLRRIVPEDRGWTKE